MKDKREQFEDWMVEAFGADRADLEASRTDDGGYNARGWCFADDAHSTRYAHSWRAFQAGHAAALTKAAEEAGE